MMPYQKYSMILLGLVAYGLSSFVPPASAGEQKVSTEKEFVETLNLLIADGKLVDAASKMLFDKYVWKGNDPSTDINGYNAALKEVREGRVSIEIDEKTGKGHLVFQQAENRQMVCEIEFSTEPVENVFDKVLTVMADSLVDGDASDRHCVFAAAAVPAETPSPPPVSGDQQEAGKKMEFVDVLNQQIDEGTLTTIAIKRLFEKYITKGQSDFDTKNAVYEAARDKFMADTEEGKVYVEIDRKSGRKHLVFQQAENRQRVCEIEVSPEPVDDVFSKVLTVMVDSLVDGEASGRRCVFDDATAAGFADQTTLLLAARLGDVTTIERLLNQGVAVDAIDPQTGQTPLHQAAERGQSAAVKVLVDHGADVNARDKSGDTPLHLAIVEAVLKDRRDLVELLVEAGADVHGKGFTFGQTPIQFLLGYCERDDDRKEAAPAEELIRYLSRHGVSLETELKSLGDEQKILKLASLMSPPPAVGDEARRAAIEGKTAFKRASDEAGFKEAEEGFEKAVKLAPWWPEAYFHLGLIQEQLRKFEKAKDNFELYLYASPGAADVEAVKEKTYELEYLHKRKQEAERWIDAGADYYNAGNDYEAVDAYKRAIELDPDYPLAHSNLGIAYGRLERYKDAIVELREALLLGKKDAVVYAELGRAYRNLDELQKAIDIMEEGVQELGEIGKFFDDRYGFLRQRLGRYYEEDGQYEKALANFEAALEYGEKDKDVDKKWVREMIDSLKRRLGR
jgi:tetratricopeptide (TPR) repeat protein